jgi:hypothetical protein
MAPELRALKFKFKRACVCRPTCERTAMLCVFIYSFFYLKTKEKERASLPPCNLTSRSGLVCLRISSVCLRISWCVSALAGVSPH